MNKNNKWILPLILLALVASGLAAWVLLTFIIPSFPALLFGQLQLTRDSAPLSPRAYQSAEFILGQVDLSEIESGVYVHLQEDVLFWDPGYPGFPRTALSRDEIRQLQETFLEAKLFSQTTSEEGFQCVKISTGNEPVYQSCPEGQDYWDQLQNYRLEAFFDHQVGIFLLSLTNGQVVEIRIYPGEGGMGFNPEERGGPWWFDGISATIPGLNQIVARTKTEPIAVYWPGNKASVAHARGRMIFGSRYQQALDTVRDSSQVRGVFGEIMDIRPAVGNHYYCSWMDCNSIFLTFYVRGSRGEGVVIIQGEDCFDLRMVFEGKPIPVSYEYECP